ncbi:hypothetical protein AAE478_009265 [Parahypoxylon ruwenzoriense]
MQAVDRQPVRQESILFFSELAHLASSYYLFLDPAIARKISLEAGCYKPLLAHLAVVQKNFAFFLRSVDNLDAWLFDTGTQIWNPYSFSRF